MTILSASCDGFGVAYLDRMDGAYSLEPTDQVRICVPESDGSKGYELSLALGISSAQIPVVFPDICIVPPAKGGQLAGRTPVSLTIFAIDRKFCDDESMRAYGTRARMDETYVAPDPFLRRSASLIASAFRLKNDPGSLSLEPVARDVARHVIFTYGRANGASAKGISAERLNRVLAKIDGGLEGTLRLKELADEAHMSEFHFSRMFRHSTGYSPHMFITLRRMDRARELLGTTARPLDEIAEAVGYKTQAHFTSVFHSYCGMTPGAYRRCHASATLPQAPVRNDRRRPAREFGAREEQPAHVVASPATAGE